MALATVATAAERLKLAEGTIRAAIRQGAIPAIRLGRRVRISEAVLDALERCGHPLLSRRAKEGG